MGRKPVIGEERIRRAALAEFMEKGYDAASMRDIAARAGCSVGLAYNYFSTKDDMFTGAMEEFFAYYEERIKVILQNGRRNPFSMFYEFFGTMERETAAFRVRYPGKVHWTVKCAIRERTLDLIRPYIREMLDILSPWLLCPLDLDVTATVLTNGIGSTIIHGQVELWQTKQSEVVRAARYIIGLDPAEGELSVPLFAEQRDADGVFALAERLQDSFPGYDGREMRAAISQKLAARELIVVRLGGEVVGAVAFDRGEGNIDYLAVDKRFRRRGVAGRMVISALAQLPVGSAVKVATFRADDPAGKDALPFWAAMGFTPSGETECGGCRCAILSRKVPATADELKNAMRRVNARD